MNNYNPITLSEHNSDIQKQNNTIMQTKHKPNPKDETPLWIIVLIALLIAMLIGLGDNYIS